jgi:hypothetical protein
MGGLPSLKGTQVSQSSGEPDCRDPKRRGEPGLHILYLVPSLVFLSHSTSGTVVNQPLTYQQEAENAMCSDWSCWGPLSPQCLVSTTAHINHIEPRYGISRAALLYH